MNATDHAEALAVAIRATSAADAAMRDAQERRDAAILGLSLAGTTQKAIAELIGDVRRQYDPTAVFRQASVSAAAKQARTQNVTPQHVTADDLIAAEHVLIATAQRSHDAYAARTEAMRQAISAGWTTRQIAAHMTAVGADLDPPGSMSTGRVTQLVNAENRQYLVHGVQA